MRAWYEGQRGKATRERGAMKARIAGQGKLAALRPPAQRRPARRGWLPSTAKSLYFLIFDMAYVSSCMSQIAAAPSSSLPLYTTARCRFPATALPPPRSSAAKHPDRAFWLHLIAIC